MLDAYAESTLGPNTEDKLHLDEDKTGQDIDAFLTWSDLSFTVTVTEVQF